MKGSDAVGLGMFHFCHILLFGMFSSVGRHM
jgi:hypothetical protein